MTARRDEFYDSEEERLHREHWYLHHHTKWLKRKIAELEKTHEQRSRVHQYLDSPVPE